MSYGLQLAGIRVLGGVDSDEACQQTYEANVRGAAFVRAGVETLGPSSLARRVGISVDDDALLFVGCTPCQFWSKIRTAKDKAVKTAFLLKSFARFVRHFRPGFVVVENVPGLLVNKSQSPLPSFVSVLQRCGYACAEGVVNANRYGVPQNRMRYVLLASRLVSTIELPPGDTDHGPVVRSVIGAEHGFKRLSAGQQDPDDNLHVAARLSDRNLMRIRITPHSGGTRLSWSDNPLLQIPAYEGRDQVFRDVYGRMWWDRPAPTITTRFNSLSNGRFGHPDEDRAISLREGAALQTFPRTFVFQGPDQATIARQIGNAVPPELARRIGEHVRRVRDRA